MFSMYPDAKVFYREYVQNAYDAIVEATRKGVLPAVKDGNISININTTERYISILDNGIGISVADVPKFLLNIADGNKDGITTAGQYGIGRLVGARYCKKLIFKTSTIGEEKYSEVIFDTDLAQKIIHDKNDHSTATEVIARITSINYGDENIDDHYFEVKMEDVDTSYKELLKPNVIKEYLQEVAPIDYELEFKNILYKNCLPTDFIELDKNIKNVRLSINEDKDIRRRYGLKIDGTGDEINALQFFKINDEQYGDLGWGWFAITKFSKEIPSTDKNRCIRLRKQNIQIGDSKVLNKFFKQGRGNNYFYGEIHATHKNLRPDSARDGLAPTPEAISFQEHINSYFADLGSVYQTANTIKNINRDIQVETTLSANENSIDDQNASTNKVIKKLDELNKIKERAQKEGNSAVVKIISIHESEIKNAIDNSNIKIDSPKEPVKKENYQTEVHNDKQEEKKEQPNNDSRITDIFEPLNTRFSPEEIKLIRRVCVAFSQNCSIQERPIIEQLKKKVIKVLSK